MDYNFDIAIFEKYFHYGLNYDKNDILDAIIIKSSDVVNAWDSDVENLETNHLECTINMIKNLYIQFERFINLPSDTSNKWYSKVNQDTVNGVVMQRIQELKKNHWISVVTYSPMYGIYINDRALSFEKNELTGRKREEGIGDWIKKDIVPILIYLAELETTNPYQYDSLFLDTKYARNKSVGNIENLAKVKSLYTAFMEMVKPAREDVSELFEGKLTLAQENYIKENCADYWTITDLKQQAKTNQYEKKVRNCYKSVKSLENDERWDNFK